jgi:ABC-type multidrug transport system ATPase subunit
VPSDYVSSYFALFANAKYGGKDLLPEMCKRFSVDGLLSKRLSELSGGQWRRVQCAAHFSVQAPVRFLDEPETGLDLDAVEELVRQIRGARSRGEIVVLTTHNEPFLAATANQVVYLKDGVCQWVSSKPMFAEYGPRLSLG